MKFDTRWIKVSNSLPKEGTRVFYYFSFLSTPVWAGYYNGIDEDGYGKCFSSKHGFLTGDVTHWMPRDGDNDDDDDQENCPAPPRCHYESFIEENYSQDGDG